MEKLFLTIGKAGLAISSSIAALVELRTAYEASFKELAPVPVVNSPRRRGKSRW